MHDGMQYDPIQGQGHEALKESRKFGHFQRLSPPNIYKVKVTSPVKSEIACFQRLSPPPFIMGAGK